MVASFPTESIAFGLALVTSIAGVAQTGLALLLLRRKLGGLGLLVLVKKFAIFALAAVPAAGAGVGVLVFLGGGNPAGFLMSQAVNAALGMGLIAVVMTVVYGIFLVLLRSEDIGSVLGPVGRRLGLSRDGNTSL